MSGLIFVIVIFMAPIIVGGAVLLARLGWLR